MTEKINKKWVLNKRPEGMPEDDCWKLVEVPVPEIEEGTILIKTLYLSIDPYMRGRMNDAKSYAKAVEIGEVMEAGAVSQVIKSKSKNFKEGDFVEGRTGWQDNPTVHENKLRLIDPSMAPLSTAIGV
jgi:hypothetical protein